MTIAVTVNILCLFLEILIKQYIQSLVTRQYRHRPYIRPHVVDTGIQHVGQHGTTVNSGPSFSTLNKVCCWTLSVIRIQQIVV